MAGRAHSPSEMTDSTLLEDLIAAHLVLPNHVTVPVKKGWTSLKAALPSALCGIHTGCSAHGPGPRAEKDGRSQAEGISSDGNAYFCPVRALASHFMGPRLSLRKVE